MWYTGNLLFKAVHVNRPDPEPVWEERIVLLEAQDETQAKLLAEHMGRDEQHEYYVSKADNDLLRWTFVKVQKLRPIEDATLRSGTELFSRFLRQSEVDRLRTPFEDDQTKAV
jgi:hypothetical protein